MRRRTLLQLGLASSIVLIGSGIGLGGLKAGWVQGHFSPQSYRVMRSVARGVLEGCLPSLPAQAELALDAHMARLEAAVAAFPDRTQTELSRLLSLLASPWGRRGLAGLEPSWTDATSAQVQAAMQAMRGSSWDLRQQAYHALRDLTNAAYFADASTWLALGYPGPRPL